MLAIIHGYSLDGSGSCIYVRNVTERLAQRGRDIILFCQEPSIEAYPFVSECYAFAPDGSYQSRFKRRTTLPGKVIAFIPYLKNNLLPVFVRGTFFGFDRVKTFSELTDPEQRHYIDSNLHALRTVIREYPVRTLFGQHIVMASYTASLAAQAEREIDYYIFPHGSEIEYLIKVDPRYKPMALQALEGAAGVITGSPEMTRRIKGLFQGKRRFKSRMVSIPIGIDAALFSEPLGRPETGRFAALKEEVQEERRRYGGTPDCPQGDFLERLETVDVERDTILCNFGRLLPAKGVHDLIFVAPHLLRTMPHLKIVIVGVGPFEQVFKQMVDALQAGDERRFFEWLGQTSSSQEGGLGDYYQSIRCFLGKRKNRDYIALAGSFPWRDRLLFAGYLRHPALCLLLSLSDVSLFPSIVPEAYCLALYEATAAGSFPIATDQGGLRHGLAQLGQPFAPDIRRLMRLPVPGPTRMQWMMDRIPKAFRQVDPGMKRRLARLVGEHYNWSTVIERLDSLFHRSIGHTDRL